MNKITYEFDSKRQPKATAARALQLSREGMTYEEIGRTKEFNGISRQRVGQLIKKAKEAEDAKQNT